MDTVWPLFTPVISISIKLPAGSGDATTGENARFVISDAIIIVAPATSAITLIYYNLNKKPQAKINLLGV